MKYMKRVSAELETVGGCPEEEELIVQGVRFAFRVHQVKLSIPAVLYIQQIVVSMMAHFCIFEPWAVCGWF